jgi:hypothetical protein
MGNSPIPRPWPRRGAHMYIGIGTALLIIVIVIILL